jgi:hypothetical protein
MWMTEAYQEKFTSQNRELLSHRAKELLNKKRDAM